MIIDSFKSHASFVEICKKDDTGRNIGYSCFEYCMFVGRNMIYPNVLIQPLTTPAPELETNIIYSPYDEKIMSLNRDSFYDNNEYVGNAAEVPESTCYTPLFFFVYNFDNYYHFIYDTLPYLFVYFELKKTIPDLKIAINYPNASITHLYPFNLDFLKKLVDIKDLVFINTNTLYCSLYVTTSLTHGGHSNRPPRPELYSIIDRIKNNIDESNIRQELFGLDKIYISRRTWIHNDLSNIGTNYTTRRKMVNEDELVCRLVLEDMTEIFTENLNLDEKVYLFSNARLICGSIGGGMSNLLFSPPSTRAIVIVTPFFLEINQRFHYSMEHTRLTYLNCTSISSNTKVPLFCRVKMIETGIIGEICNYDREKDQYLVCLSNNDIAGFNNTIQLKSDWYSESDFTLLDKGLNSPYIVENIDELISLIE